MTFLITRSILPVVTAAIIGLTSTSSAQEPNKAAGANAKASTKAAAGAKNKLRQVSGEVVAVKQVEIKKANVKNTVAMIKTNKGSRRLIVDLGPVGAEGVNVKKGDKISVEGVVVRLRDTAVLVSKRVKAGGKVITVNRSAQEKQIKENQQKKA